MLSQLAKFIVALNSNTHTGQLAGGIVCGLFLGLTPFWSLHNLFILAVLCVVRLNISFTLISLAVFSTLAISIAPSAIHLGEQLLHAPSLQDFWTERYQSDIWRLTHFNHTLTLGSFVIALTSALPLFVLSYSLIKRYREQFLAWLNKTKLMKAIKASKWFERANKVNEFREAL